jgi:hypothetical protein
MPYKIMVRGRLDGSDHMHQRVVLPGGLIRHDAMQGRQLLRQHRHADRLLDREVLPARLDLLPSMHGQDVRPSHRHERVFNLHRLRARSADQHNLLLHKQHQVLKLLC